MGVWGTSPFSSDDFADMVGDVLKKADAAIDREIDKLYKRSKDAAEKWAWVGVVMWAHHAGFAVYEYMKVAREVVLELKDDQEFLSRWRSPQARKQFLAAADHVIKSIDDGEIPGLVPSLEDEYNETDLSTADPWPHRRRKPARLAGDRGHRVGDRVTTRQGMEGTVVEVETRSRDGRVEGYVVADARGRKHHVRGRDIK